MSEQLITLGGRAFRPIADCTIEHDYWLMGQIRSAGIDKVFKEPEETADEFALRLMRDLINSGHTFAILGGTLMPAEKEPHEWTPQMAAETAAYLKQLTDPKDKQTLNGCTASLLAGFFASGLAVLTTSPRSMGLAGASPMQEIAAP